MTDPEHASQLEALNKRIHLFAETDTERFLRLDLESQLNFAELRPQFEFLRSLCARLDSLDFSVLPAAILAEAVTAFDRLETLAQALATFSVVKATEAGRPVTDARNAAAAAFRDKFPAHLKQLTSALAFAQLLAEHSWAEKRRETTAILEERLTKAVTNAQEMTDRLKQLEELAQAAAQKAGITRHAVYFHDEAENHEKSAGAWLSRTAWLAGGIMLLTIVNLGMAFGISAPERASDATYLLIAKLLVFSTLVSATLWCARVYRAHKHNAVVNRHRQHALSSFESFASSTADPEVKNVVLLQATQSIFAPQHSGFGTTEADPAVASPIVELVRSAASPSK